MLIEMASQNEEAQCSRGLQKTFNQKEVILPTCNLCDVVLIGLDIGGSLAKVAYSLINHKKLSGKGTKIYLASFDVEKFDECIEFIQNNVLALSNSHRVLIGATGVGSHKYREQLLLHFPHSEILKVSVDSRELQQALQGIRFVWQHLPPSELLHPLSDQVTVDSLEYQCPLVQSKLLPCLVASLGSSLIIAKVNEDGDYEALVGASTQGGLSLLGLGALLTSARTFEDLVLLAKKGDRKNVDLTVKDTAGGDYNAVSQSCLVSSFGWAAKKPNAQFAEEDLASSLLYCITDQMAQTSYLVAQAHSLQNVVFYGSYLSAPTVIEQIKEKMAACSFFLKHRVTPIFMRHEGYMGAIGALVEQHSQHLTSLDGRGDR